MESVSICKVCQSECNYWAHGHYPRNEIDSNGNKKIKEISRCLCRKDPKKFKTFSYLPEDLIPYHQYSLTLIFAILQRFIFSIEAQQNKKLDEATNQYNRSGKILDISLSHIQWFKRLFEKAINRYCSTTEKSFSNIREFIDYCKEFVDEHKFGVLAVCQAFYRANNRFLFGVASQHRNRI